MKKLLFLAVAVVMGVMNAQAKDLYAHVGVTFDTEAVGNYADYKTVYILFSDKFDTWEKDKKAYDALKDYSIGSYTEGNDNQGEGYMQYYVDEKGFYLMAYNNEYNNENLDVFVALVTDGKSFATLRDYTLVPKDPAILMFENEDDPIASTTPFAGAVPEPTSGLLLLLGVAGLALKRKRA